MLAQAGFLILIQREFYTIPGSRISYVLVILYLVFLLSCFLLYTCYQLGVLYPGTVYNIGFKVCLVNELHPGYQVCLIDACTSQET